MSDALELTQLDPPGGEPSDGRGESRRSVVFLTGTLAGGNAIAQGLRLVGGVFQARLVPPLVMGQFSSINQILGYLPFCNWECSTG